MSGAVVLSDVAEIFDGPHATPTRVTKGPYFLNITSLCSGRLDLTQSDHVSEEDFLIWTRRVQPGKGDILFSYETRLGQAAIMPAGLRACLGRRMALLRPKPDRVLPRYLLCYYLSPEFQALIEQNTIHGATVNRIGLAAMGSWPVRLPSLAEQSKVAEVLGALDEKIMRNIEENQTLSALRDTLLPELMSGRLRVRDAEEQVGEVLQ